MLQLINRVQSQPQLKNKAKLTLTLRDETQKYIALLTSQVKQGRIKTDFATEQVRRQCCILEQNMRHQHFTLAALSPLRNLQPGMIRFHYGFAHADTVDHPDKIVKKSQSTKHYLEKIHRERGAPIEPPRQKPLKMYPIGKMRHP